MSKLFVTIYRYFSAHKAVMYAVLFLTTIVFGYFAMKVRFDENIATLLPKTDQNSEVSIAFEDVKVKDKIFLEIKYKDEAQTDPSRLVQAMSQFMDDCVQGDSLHLIDNCFHSLDDDDMMNALYYGMGALPCHLGPEFYDFLDQHLTEEYLDSASRGEVDFDLMDMGSFSIIDGQLFSRDSTLALAFISPSFSSLDTRVCIKLENYLHACTDAFEAQNPDMEAMYHGIVIEGSFNSRQIKKDLVLTVGISLLLICILIGICFKSRRTIIHILAPVLYGCIFSLALVYLMRGSISLIAMGIGAIVLGVAMSYCLHIITHYKYVHSVETVLLEESRPVCLGCLTTIGAFAGLLLTSSELLKDFGIFASFALVGTTLFSLIFLPHFFTEEDTQKNEKAFNLVNRINSYPLDRNKFAVVALVLVSIVCIFMSGKVKFDSDLNNIGYREPRMVRSEKIFNDKINGSHFNIYYAAHASTLDSAIIYNRVMCKTLDSLKATGDIYGYSGIEGLLIPEDEQRSNIRLWKDYWTEDKIESTYSLLRKAVEKNGWNTGDFDVPETFRLMAESDYEPQCIYDAAAMPESLLSNFVEKLDDGWLVFTGVLLDKSNVRHVGDEITAVDHIIALDPFYYAGDMVELVHSDFNIVLLFSSIFVFIVLLCSFKSLILSLIAFLPMALSWYIVKGMMAIFGLEFNLINIMISTFIFGIGVDYSIFVMEGLISKAKYKSYRLLICHKSAIFFSALILLIVISSLLFASHPAIYSIGISTIIGMSATILITYALQPLIFRLLQKNGKLRDKVLKINK